MTKRNLGDWCKWYEKNFSPEQMIPKLPVIIRIDGNKFSTWTRGLPKPYCTEMSDAMVMLTKFLVGETNAVVGYTQSDEITLILYSDDVNKPVYHDGEKQKILSKLTSKLSNYFNNVVIKKFPLLKDKPTACFDCRIYQVPTKKDACAQLVWRENDAVKNSILGLAQSLFSHASMEKLNQSMLQDKMMLEKNVNWNDVEPRFKRGIYVSKRTVLGKFTTSEIESLPEKHAARTNPDLQCKRRVISTIEVPPINKVINMVDFVFNGEEPVECETL